MSPVIAEPFTLPDVVIVDNLTSVIPLSFIRKVVLSKNSSVTPSTSFVFM